MTKKQESILKNRLRRGAITWIVHVSQPLDSIKRIIDFQENAAEGEMRSNLFLAMDETFNLFSFEDVCNAGAEGFRFDEFTIFAVKDYGTVTDLDLDGGFGYMGGVDNDLGRVVEFRVRFQTEGGRKREARLVLARVDKMEFITRFLVSGDSLVRVRMSTLFMCHSWLGFNPQYFAGSWPAMVAAAFGATKLISDKGSVEKLFALNGYRDKDDDEIYAQIVEKYPWFGRLPSGGIVGELCSLDAEFSLYELGVCRGE